MAEYWWALWYP